MRKLILTPRIFQSNTLSLPRQMKTSPLLLRLLFYSHFLLDTVVLCQGNRRQNLCSFPKHLPKHLANCSCLADNVAASTLPGSCWRMAPAKATLIGQQLFKQSPVSKKGIIYKYDTKNLMYTMIYAFMSNHEQCPHVFPHQPWSSECASFPSSWSCPLLRAFPRFETHKRTYKYQLRFVSLVS